MSHTELAWLERTPRTWRWSSSLNRTRLAALVRSCCGRRGTLDGSLTSAATAYSASRAANTEPEFPFLRAGRSRKRLRETSTHINIDRCETKSQILPVFS